MYPDVHAATNTNDKAKKTHGQLLVDFDCGGELLTNLVDFASSVVISVVIFVSVVVNLCKTETQEITVI